MSDLISRQDAIDALNAMCDIVCEYTKKQRSCMCGSCFLGFVIDMINELRSAQQWIPVTERLPEKVGTYLVTTNRNNVYLWYYNTATTIEWQRLLKAWMPVPGPYKE